jgi:hypothetical protein
MERGTITRYVPSFLMPAAVWLRATPFGIAYTQHRLKGVGAEFLWQIRKFREAMARKSVARLPSDRRAAILEELAATDGRPNATISVVCLSRRLGNRDSNLCQMLLGLLATARDPSRIEVLIKIDLDDDLIHYLRLKRMFRDRLALRIIASPRGRGAADMHRYYAELLEHSSSCSRVWLGATDDGIFVMTGWDTELQDAARQHPQGLFIGGELPFEKVISMEGPLPARDAPIPLYQYCTNNFWFCGVPLLRVCARTVQGVRDWTPFGSSLCVDSFFSALTATIWEEHGISIYVQRGRIMERKGVVSFLFDPARNAARTAGIVGLMSPQHREVRKRIAWEIAATSVRHQQSAPKVAGTPSLQDPPLS